MKMQMIPPVLNDTGDCCCQCPPSGPDGWCHCNDDYNGKGDDIENAITCDLVWTERQPNGRKKYFKVVSGSSQQNMPVVLPTASLTKRGVVQLTNDLSDREDLAITPKAVKGFKEQLDRETADRVAKDTDLQNQINKEKADRANADADLLSKINQEKADRENADNALSNRITSAESKADSALTKTNNSVTSVTSDGNATVTVTKADGTSNSFAINNVAHATSADNATHATNADTATKATNADHALVADRLSSGSEADTSTFLGLPQWSKNKVANISDGSFDSTISYQTKYTCDCNCFIELNGTTTVAPTQQYKSVLKVNNTTINTWDISNQHQTGQTEYGFFKASLFKKGDVISLNIDTYHNGGETLIKLNILPLE